MYQGKEKASFSVDVFKVIANAVSSSINDLARIRPSQLERPVLVYQSPVNRRGGN